MLGQRRRRWANVKTAFFQCILLAGASFVVHAERGDLLTKNNAPLFASIDTNLATSEETTSQQRGGCAAISTGFCRRTVLLASDLGRNKNNRSSALKRQKAVSAYLWSEKILPFAFLRTVSDTRTINVI